VSHTWCEAEFYRDPPINGGAVFAGRQECTVCGLAIDPIIGDGVNDSRLPTCEEYLKEKHGDTVMP
jgi:hypothetical protein